MNIKLILISCILIVFTNCSKDETPNSKPEIDEQEKPENPVITTYFTAQIDSKANTEYSDDYLIIHNSNGKLIDFKPFEKGEALKFNAYSDSITNSFTVTNFFISKGVNGAYSLILKTYPNIKKGSVWNISQYNWSTSSNYETTGTFYFNVTGDSEQPDAFSISNNNGLSLAALELYDAYGENWSYGYYMNMENYAKDYMVTGLTPEGNSKYYLFENVNNNDRFEIDYNDFKEFDAYIDFSSPSRDNTTVKLVGHKDENIVLGIGWDPQLGNGNILYHHNYYSKIEANTEALKLGYLENYFSAYSFYASYIYDYGYSKKYFGKTPPSIFRVPEKPKSTILNSDINNFKINMELDYIRSVSLWQKNERTDGAGYKTRDWYIYAAPDTYPAIEEFPEELTTIYPDMKLDELEYYSTNFFLDSFSNEEFIEKTFVTQDIETTPRNEETITLYSGR